MDVRHLTQNLIQITALRTVNAYLVREDDGFTLVDALTIGWGDDLYRIARDADGAIVRIAITHGHNDHVGSIDSLMGEADTGTTTVLMGAEDARIHAGERPAPRGVPGMWRGLDTVPGVRLANGDRVGSLEVVASPGHSPGHLAFRDIRDNSLIAGDAFTSLGGLDVPNRLLSRLPIVSISTWDRDQALASARKLRALEPTLLVVGHGKARRDPTAAMDRAIARAS